MSIQEFMLETRSRFLKEASDSNFLSAVFLIDHYNQHSRSLFGETFEAITPEEVFGEFNAIDLQEARRKIERLGLAGDRVGMSFFDYEGTIPFESAALKMRSENPGFSERCYDLITASGIQSMR